MTPDQILRLVFVGAPVVFLVLIRPALDECAYDEHKGCR